MLRREKEKKRKKSKKKRPVHLRLDRKQKKKKIRENTTRISLLESPRFFIFFFRPLEESYYRTEDSRVIIAIKKRVKIIFAKSCDTRPHGSTNEIKVKAYCIVFALRYAESKQDRTIETRARTYAPYNPKHIQSRNFEIVYRLLSERLTLLSSSPSLSPPFFSSMRALRHPRM